MEAEYIKVMMAYQQGKPIEFSPKDEETWEPVDRPSWNFQKLKYRVKSTVKYRLDLYEKDGKLQVFACNLDNNVLPPEGYKFVKPLTDWQEVNI